MDQLNHSPNESLAKALALFNAPFCLIAIIGLPFLLYITGSQTFNGEILKFRSIFSHAIWLFLLCFGLYLEYGYFQTGYREYSPEREQSIWLYSAIFNGFTFMYWILYFFLQKANKVEEQVNGLLILFFILFSLIYGWFSIKAYRRLELPPPIY